MTTLYHLVLKTKTLTWKRIEEVIGPCDRDTWRPRTLDNRDSDRPQACGLAPGRRTARTWVKGPGTHAVVNIVHHSNGYCIFPALRCDTDEEFQCEIYEKLKAIL